MRVRRSGLPPAAIAKAEATRLTIYMEQSGWFIGFAAVAGGTIPVTDDGSASDHILNDKFLGYSV